MADKGWIKLYRDLQDNWIWQDKPFSKGQAWVDLLMLANYEDKKAMYKGKVVTCERGDVNLSIAMLSDRWGWSRHKTRDFLSALESDQMVDVKGTAKGTTNRTVVTIGKYSVYQNQGQQTGQKKDSKRTAEGQVADTTKKDKKERKEKIQKESAGVSAGADPAQTVPEQFRDRFGDDYEAFSKWRYQ